MLKKAGRCQVSLVTANWEGFCYQTGKDGISIYEAEPDGSLTYVFQCSFSDFYQIRKIAEKQGDHLKLQNTPGFLSFCEKTIKRPILILGLCLMIFFFLYLPTRVLFIRVSGNSEVPDLQILEAAAESGVRFGASRKDLRGEEIKNQLLQKIPQLSWAGIRTRGCVAEVSVREQKRNQIKVQRIGAWSILAERDGIVEQCTVRKGELLCRKGQAVCKDQILISGLPSENSKNNFCAADGEIYALTSRTQAAVTPSQYIRRGCKQGTGFKITLLVGKKRIKLCGSSGNEAPSCGRMYKEYCITLPGGYRLPAALVFDRYTACELNTVLQPSEKIYHELMAAADQNLLNKMIAGRILRRRDRFYLQNDIYHLEGSFLCHEMIGRIRQEKNGVKQDIWNES